MRPEFFSNSRYAWALVVVLIVYSTNLGLFVIVVPGAVQQVHGGDLAHASLLLAPGYAFGAILGALSGQVAKLLNSRQAILASLGIIIVSLALMAMFIQSAEWIIIPAGMLFVGGFALMYAPLVNTAIRGIPAAKTGIAIGFYNLTINIAVPLGIAYCAKLVDVKVDFFSDGSAAGIYASVLWILVGISVLAAVIFAVTDSVITRRERIGAAPVVA